MKLNIPLASLIAIVVVGTGIVAFHHVNEPQNALLPVTDETMVMSNTLSEATPPVPPGDGSTPATPSITTPVVSPKTETPRVTTNTTLPPTHTAPFVTTVYYDGSKFIPEVVTIPEDGTVVFENIGKRPLWVASANHETHAKYPVKSPSDCFGSSFDQCEAMGTGGSWSFTFTELGEWRYHNHMRDYDTGKVIVLTKKKYLEELEELQK